MGVSCNKAVLLAELAEAADVHVLTDNSDLGIKSVLDGLAFLILPGLSQECIDISCLCLQSLCSNLCNIGAELLILCNEVGLGVDLDSNSLLAVLCLADHDDTLCSDTAGLLLCGGLSVLSEELYCLIDISIGSGQGLLAVHHAGTGNLS